jgi:hypothetical protein
MSKNDNGIFSLNKFKPSHAITSRRDNRYRNPEVKVVICGDRLSHSNLSLRAKVRAMLSRHVEVSQARANE